jgi:acid phosphatase family membrane protein YuiD
MNDIFPLPGDQKEGLIVLVLSGLTWLCALIAKLITDAVYSKRLSSTDFLRYGGWPSAHTSSFAGIAVSIFIVQGLTVPFLISGSLAFLVVRDTLSIRPEIDKNSKATLRKDAKFLSHSIFEIFSGFLFGVFGPIIMNHLLSPYYQYL